MNAAFSDCVGNYTSVVAHIRRFHFGDVEVACLLGHKPARVLGDERWVLIEDPREGKVCGQIQRCEGRQGARKNIYCIYTSLILMYR